MLELSRVVIQKLVEQINFILLKWLSDCLQKGKNYYHFQTLESISLCVPILLLFIYQGWPELPAPKQQYVFTLLQIVMVCNGN